MSKIYYTEQMAFTPGRAWAVIDGQRNIVSVHKSKGDAAKHAISVRVNQPGHEVSFTRCVVLPNFSIK